MIKMQTPKTGDVVPVHVPTETLRASVLEVKADDLIVVQLSVTVPFSKGHSYRLNDVLLCERQNDGIAESWEAVRKLEEHA